MKLVENGIDIPNKLLRAHEDGCVVFFCGAGVSKNTAKKPDFIQLAKAIVDKLTSNPKSQSRKHLRQLKEIEESYSVIMPIDHLFSLLEDEFERRVVEDVIFDELSIKDSDKGKKLESHQIILKLATTSSKKVQLVTTNFDKLFSEVDSTLKVYSHADIVNTKENLDGIVHLHGCLDNDENNKLVLSSRDFAKAYMTDAWATTFFKKILEKYSVVFIGYSANDPPIRYLLEALSEETKNGIYAFDQESSHWNSGIQKINYPDGDFISLWQTLEKWAIKAKDEEKWQTEILKLAEQEPEALKPFERELVAYLISSVSGAKVFKNHNPCPPATWINVFDKKRRYKKATEYDKNFQKHEIDYFDLYHLESESRYNKQSALNEGDNKEANLTQESNSNEILDGKWDAFYDLKDTQTDVSYINQLPTNLPKRVCYIFDWIVKLTDKEEIINWVIDQHCLHDTLRKKINRRQKNSQIWLYILQQQESCHIDEYHQYTFEREVGGFGWCVGLVQKYITMCRPQVKAETAKKLGLEFISITEYGINNIEIPNEYLKLTIQGLRNNLEYASVAAKDVDRFNKNEEQQGEIKNTLQYPKEEMYETIREHVDLFIRLFERLIEIEDSAAYQEFSAWTSSEGSAIFTYLKLYACRYNSLLKSSEVGKIIIGLSQQDFWSGIYELTLLESLSKRWDDLSQTTKKRLETKLLEDEECENSTDKAFSVLQRIAWLNKKGVAFTFDFEQKKKGLENICPDWKEKNIEEIDKGVPFLSYTITSNEDPKELKDIEDSELIETAHQLHGRSSRDLSKENTPLIGLIKEDPEYVFKVISSHQSKHNDWALKLYLNCIVYSDEGFQQKIANKNYQLIDKINTFINDNYIVKDEQNINTHTKSIIGGFIRINERFGKELNSDIFHQSIKNAIGVYEKHPEFDDGTITSDNRDEFVLTAINSNTYYLVNSLIRNSSEVVNGVPSTKWLDLAEAILNFQKPLSDYATFAFSRQIHWLHHHHPEWVEKHLLSRSMIENGNINNAFWLGFLHLPRVPNKKLYKHIKSGLPLLVCKDLRYNNIYKEYYETISSIFFLLWKDKCIPDQEIREIIYTSHHDFISSFIRILPNYCEKHIDSVVKFFQDIWPKEKEMKNTENTSSFLYLLCYDVKYFEKIYGVIGNYLSVIDDTYSVHIMKANIADEYPNETMEILSKVLPEDILNDTSIGLIGILDKIALAKDQDLLNEEALSIYLRFRKITQ